MCNDSVCLFVEVTDSLQYTLDAHWHLFTVSKWQRPLMAIVMVLFMLGLFFMIYSLECRCATWKLRLIWSVSVQQMNNETSFQCPICETFFQLSKCIELSLSPVLVSTLWYESTIVGRIGIYNQLIQPCFIWGQAISDAKRSAWLSVTNWEEQPRLSILFEHSAGRTIERR